MVLASLLVAAPEAVAYPQWNLALDAGAGVRRAPTLGPCFTGTLGLRSDVTFGERTPYAWRAGFFAGVGSTDFRTLEVSAGAVLHLPAHPSFPLLLSVGGVVDAVPEAGRAGVLGRVWWGSRSLNYHGVYGMAVGLWVQGRYHPGDQEADVLAGVDADLYFIAIPAIALYEWIRR